MHNVPEIDYLVLTALSTKREPISIMALAEELKLDQAKVTPVCLSRGQQGELTVEEQTVMELKLGAKGKPLAERSFPERLIAQALLKNGGQAEITALPTLTGLEAKEVGQSLRWLEGKGWAKKEGKEVIIQPAGQTMTAELGDDEKLVAALAKHGTATREFLIAEGINVESAQRLLEGRTGVIEEKERKIRLVSMTGAGRQLVSEGIAARRQVNMLTSEMLTSGEWRNVDLRPYDVSLSSQPVYPGKEHPLVSIFQETRRVFLEMGFSEAVSPYVESSFWDFDALFQPQDHPARDMQDTFYISRPAQCQLPDEKILSGVGATHENGGDTGSVGWRYKWNRELTKRPVLRTHTTACTIRALAADPVAPRKVFCVGPVFRRETIDYKHLPVFHQVDGIIIDEHASFASLLGTITAFYRKMGFARFQFRPGFFPYTEPSVEIFVWSEKKKDWVEMGGAGIFRPEVTMPFGCRSRVLAWGFGLERLAMFRYELGSISELYRSRLSWLKETALCR